ncbi:MAG TPA: ATP-dependent helicase, partial [Nitriliruptorales bacterium]
WVGEHVDALREVFAAYTARKRRHQVADYDDLLLYWRALLTSDAGAGVCRLFDHVLVDEYQDTNAVQADILAALGRTASITVVGDDAQAIYSFRAASVANIEDFPTRFPDATVVTLERNYRSTPPILDAANAIVDASPRAYPKRLWSERPVGPRPRLVTCADEAAQSAYVCDEVLAQRERDVPLHEQAVLFRTGHHSDALELELARRDIPYVKFGGLKFLEAAHVKDLLSLLRVLDNPRDVLAWTRVLGSLDGVGPATTRAILDELGLGPDAPPDAGDGALSRFLHEPVTTPSRAAEDLDLLRSALTDCGGGRDDDDHAQPAPAEQIDRLHVLCQRTFRRRYDDADARLNDLEQLASLATEYRTRSRFLAELTLDPPNATGDLAGPPHLDDDWLVLSTIHSAKGGEWKAVYVIHAADGNIPSDMATGDPETLEEERRLLYVAVTRARDELHVSFPLRYYHRRFGLDDAHNWAQPSRFLDPARDRFDERTAGAPVLGTASGAIGSGGADAVDALLEDLFAG